MIVRTTVIFLILAVTAFLTTAVAKPLKNSPIQKIIILTYPVNIVSTEQLSPVDSSHKVSKLHPEKGTLAAGGKHGVHANLVEGAYPVKYMRGNTNGKFNGKITILPNLSAPNE